MKKKLLFILLIVMLIALGFFIVDFSSVNYVSYSGVSNLKIQSLIISILNLILFLILFKKIRIRKELENEKYN